MKINKTIFNIFLSFARSLYLTEHKYFQDYKNILYCIPYIFIQNKLLNSYNIMPRMITLESGMFTVYLNGIF